MAAIVKVISKDELQTLEKYLSFTDKGNVVLVLDSLAKEIGVVDGDYAKEYDFGGESDIQVDVVTDKDHYFATGYLDGDFTLQHDFSAVSK
jgi:hypothetical protein